MVPSPLSADPLQRREGAKLARTTDAQSSLLSATFPLASPCQAIHVHGLATPEQTRLLLDCLNKLQEKEKIHKFIRGEIDAPLARRALKRSNPSRLAQKVDFDAETAIRVLRDTGWLDEALWLAQQHGHHQWYLRMQVDERGNCGAALQHIWQLPFAEAATFMREYVMVERAIFGDHFWGGERSVVLEDLSR